MPDFRKRDSTPELMDTETVGYPDFRCCLEQLAQANRLSLAYRPTLAFFRKLAREGRLPPDRRVLVVDAGCGYGDMVRRVDRWAVHKDINLEFVGLDMNPWSARAATEATDSSRPVRWLTANLFDYRPNEEVGVIVSSLFAHHLPNTALVRFLKWMEATAQTAWFVNDLERHPLPYYALKFGFWATRRHRFMRHDGPVSVASAFKPADWVSYLEEAGLPPNAAQIQRWLPFRLCVSRIKAA